MNHAESLTLCRYVKAGCPQQAFDEYTPDAWHDLLSDLRFVDCKDAAKAITQRQPFCSPSEIRAEVRRTRADRIAKAEYSFVPPDDLGDYGQWLGEMRRRAGDGEFERPAIDLPTRDMRVIESVFPAPGDLTKPEPTPTTDVELPEGAS